MTGGRQVPFAAWDDARREPLPPRAMRYLATLAPPRASRPVPLAEAERRVPASELPPSALAALREAVGLDHVDLGAGARARHAGGASYPDLLRRRAGDVAQAPDAVVCPATHHQVRRVLTSCATHGIAVVPFGGGTSVVGGVEPLRGAFAAVIALDLSRMAALREVDPVSLTATFEPGVTGAAAEALLAEQGLTLGHFPQSFERATLGGYVATRSAGQASTGYGRIDDLVVSLQVATAAGTLRLGAGPGSAAGPDLRRLFVGSEGTLGVLTEVTLRVRPVPATRRYSAWLVPSFAAGVDLLRTLAQSAGPPDLARLSDEAETATTLALSGPTGVAAIVTRAFFRRRGLDPGCLAIAGWEGEAIEVAHRRRRARSALKAAGGLSLGGRPAASWRRERFTGPYLRDRLLDNGYLVETLETAAYWSGLLALHAEVRDALDGALSAGGRRAHVMCHVSHLYPTGASLYFTVLAGQVPGDEAGQWARAKEAASAAIAAAGATITHHHGVGTEHLPYLGGEVGPLGLAALAAVKGALDPAGILNPGKLLPGPAGRPD